MTKLCTHGRGEREAMRQLEQSLRRLKTDYLDLWQIHECVYDNDADRHFAPRGAADALLRAQREGKVRLLGFTGHKRPEIHLRMLAHDFPFDTCQLPLNQIELADVTALTPVHVNRVLATLRRDTGTSLHKGVLHVPDLGALEKLAGYDFRYLDPVPADSDVNGREPPCMAAGMGFEAQTLLQELHTPTSV